MRDVQMKMKFETEDQLKELASKPYFCRVQIINWDGPGWYYIFRYSQPCPRGCCRDSVFEAITAKQFVQNVSEEINDLKRQLSEAKEHVGEQDLFEYDELHDLINECVCDALAEWGTTSKVDNYHNEQNVPLRDVLNEQCGPLIDDLYEKTVEFIKQNE